MTLTRLLFALAVVAPLVAQTETGQVAGTVFGPDGRGLSSARVEFSSPAIGFNRAVVTSSHGVYSVANLMPAEYVIRVSASGLSSEEKRVVVPAGTRVDQDFRLNGAKGHAAYQASQSAGELFTGDEI